MAGSRVVTGLIAATVLAIGGASGVVAGDFVTGSMSGYYSNVEPRDRNGGPRVIAAEPPAQTPADTYAPMPAIYWSAAPALTDAPPPAAADDSHRWERESEAEARRWQAHIDREVREAEQSGAPAPAIDDAAPDQPSPDHGPAAPTLAPDQPPA